MIYGVKPNVNQSERGLKETAKLSAKEWPEVNHIVHKDICVDNCLPGEQTWNKALERADQIELASSRYGFSIKRIHIHWEMSTSNISVDESSIDVAGIKRQPKKIKFY